MFKYLAFIFLIVGCKGETLNITRNIKKEIPQFTNWLRPQLIESFSFKTTSFPIWFNEVWLEDNQINTVVLKKHYVTNEHPYRIPKLNHTFTFKKNFIERYTLEELYDDRIIGKHTFKYSNQPDSNGYSKPKYDFTPYRIGKNKKGYNYFETLNASNGFSVLMKADYSEKMLTYSAPENKNLEMHTYLLDSSAWSYYAIDKFFEPSVKDLFTYGSPKYPQVTFSLKNLILQPQKTEYVYQQNKVVLTRNKKGKLTREKRDFHYNEVGLFLGYTDSLFSDALFVKANTLEIRYDSFMKPFQLEESYYFDKKQPTKKHIWEIEMR